MGGESLAVADENSLDISKPGGRTAAMRGGMLRDLVGIYWFPFLLTLGLTVACYAASLHRAVITQNGQVIRRSTPTLGLFLGGIAVATVVTPGVVLAEESWFGRVVAWAGVVDAIMFVWLAPVIAGVVSFWDWGEAVCVAVAYTVALVGVASGLRGIRLPSVLAAGVTVVVGVAWLAWPVWMAPWLTGENREATVGWLVWGHPVFALNGAMLEAFGQPWAQMTVAYRLTNLGDDIAYEMPRGVWACVGVHGVIAGLVIVPQVLLSRRGNNTHPG